jgi:aspartyl-tRNA(Asn)/glutamyl-tRNA(Gln) amidotransferase subunit A
MGVFELTALQCRDLLAGGQASATELARLYLGQVAATDGRVQAYLAVDEEGALARAAAVDAKPRDQRGPW